MKTTNNNATATATSATATTAPVDIVKGKGKKATPATATTAPVAMTPTKKASEKAKAEREAKRQAEKAERERIAKGKAEIYAKTHTLSQAIKDWADVADDTLSCGVTARAFLAELGVDTLNPVAFVNVLRTLCPACVDSNNVPLRFVARTCTEMCEDKDAKPRTIHTYNKPAKKGATGVYKPLKVWDIEKVTEFDSNVLFALLEVAPRFAEMKAKKEESNKALVDGLAKGTGAYYVRTGNKATCTAKTTEAVTTFAKVTPACVDVPAHI